MDQNDATSQDYGRWWDLTIYIGGPALAVGLVGAFAMSFVDATPGSTLAIVRWTLLAIGVFGLYLSVCWVNGPRKSKILTIVALHGLAMAGIYGLLRSQLWTD